MNSPLLFLTFSCCLLAPSSASADARWRIVNGDTAIEHEYPSIVSLQKNGKHFCGGTLLNPTTVLTAAHCVEQFHIYSPEVLRRLGLKAVIGEHRLARRTGREVVRQVVRADIPSAYDNPEAFQEGNDIGLIKLETGVKPAKHIRFATIPVDKVDPTYEGMKCSVVGWGSVGSHGFGTSLELKKTNLYIVSNGYCAFFFSKARNNPSNVCAGGRERATSGCRGDSGGPLFCKTADGQRIQVGVVSYGMVPCGRINTPSVFTRVSNFAKWIQRFA